MSFLPVLYACLFFSLYIQVFLLVTFLETREKLKEALNGNTEGERTPVRLSASLPKVSIIVPCWNEERTLKGTVDSLLALSYPKEKLQVIIVDDGSTDGTAAAAREFLANPQVLFLQKENGGKYTALNMGLQYTEESDLVGCLDADSFVAPGALLEIIPYFDDPGVSAVTPFVKVHHAKTIVERVQLVEYVVSGLWRKLLSSLNAQYVTPGPFSFYRRSVFRDLGVYRPAYQTEDLEIAMRMQAAHLRIENAHTAIVYTTTPTTLCALIRQRVRWYGGFLRNAFDYRRMIFRPSYGHVGMFSMPGGALAIVSAVTLFSVALVHFGEWVRRQIVEIAAVGFRFHGFSAFNWFFLDTGVYRLLALAVLLLFIVMVFFSMLLDGDRKRFLKNSIFYFALYGLMAPLWCARTLFSVITAREGKWR